MHKVASCSYDHRSMTWARVSVRPFKDSSHVSTPPQSSAREPGASDLATVPPSGVFQQYKLVKICYHFLFFLFAGKEAGGNSTRLVSHPLPSTVLLFVALIFLLVNSDTAMKSCTLTQEKESLAALTSLMQQPGSPEVKKPPATTGDGDLSYAIVLDVKSSV